jgi:precorrin-6A/cobalt-precorrin-6A reductase
VSSRVLLIGGTSDARELARALRAAGLDVLLSTATEYGAALATSDAPSRAGSLDAAGMADLAAGVAAIVDASHPFARAASAAAREAAHIAGVAYIRFERPTGGSPDGVIVCATAEAAARAAVDAVGPAGAVLLTVGSRTLATYAEACRGAGVRCVARVLSVPESLAACAEAGFTPADVVAMQGPTSVELDEALLRHFSATVLVTKDSGSIGGVPAKLKAAKRAGALAIVVARPAEAPLDAVRSVDEAVAAVLALPGVEPLVPTAVAVSSVPPSSAHGLVHVYTGAGKGKTTAAVGLAVRAAGAGLRVAFVQFVKGGRESSEFVSLRRLGVEVTRPATASSGLMRGPATQRDADAAEAALAATRTALAGGFDLVVLDEACVASAHGLVTAVDLAAAIRDREPHVEVVLTGRGASPELLELGDYITEFHAPRHPYKRGVRARKGIEY